MNPANFIQVSCLTCQTYAAIQKQHRILYTGFASAFTDKEAITIKLHAEIFRLANDEAITWSLKIVYPVYTIS